MCALAVRHKRVARAALRAAVRTVFSPRNNSIRQVAARTERRSNNTRGSCSACCRCCAFVPGALARWRGGGRRLVVAGFRARARLRFLPVDRRAASGSVTAAIRRCARELLPSWLIAARPHTLCARAAASRDACDSAAGGASRVGLERCSATQQRLVFSSDARQQARHVCAAPMRGAVAGARVAGYCAVASFLSCCGGCVRCSVTLAPRPMPSKSKSKSMSLAFFFHLFRAASLFVCRTAVCCSTFAIDRLC
jgi:hypothetical protein